LLGRTNGVEITFNNTKKIVYMNCNNFNRVCTNPRNIFHYTNNTGFTQIYIITPENYTNAVDCGGNCN